jgi:nucleoside-diphosphate-sugar epimerase
VKNILLTGSTGFIGSEILRNLSNSNRFICINRRKKKIIKNTNQINFIYYKDYEELNKKLKKIKKIDIVIHCATHYVKNHKFEDIKKLAESNIIFGNVILENIKILKIKKFINLTTVWENYNNQKNNSFNLYSAYKKSFSNIVNYYKKNNPKVNFYNVYLSDSFGSEDRRLKIMNILRKNYKKNVATKIVSSKLFLNLLNVDDIVSGISILINKKIINGEYNLVNFNYYSISKIINKFNKKNKKKIKIKWLSNKLIKEKILKKKIIKNWLPTKSKLKDLLDLISRN